jgi:hypothetical protein
MQIADQQDNKTEDSRGAGVWNGPIAGKPAPAKAGSPFTL